MATANWFECIVKFWCELFKFAPIAILIITPAIIAGYIFGVLLDAAKQHKK